MKKDMAENEMDFDCGNEMESEGEMDIDNEYDDTMSPVSYTHLDVYKRQSMGDYYV